MLVRVTLRVLLLPTVMFPKLRLVGAALSSLLDPLVSLPKHETVAKKKKASQMLIRRVLTRLVQVPLILQLGCGGMMGLLLEPSLRSERSPRFQWAFRAGNKKAASRIFSALSPAE